MSDNRDVVYTVFHDYQYGPHKLASAEVEKRTAKSVYIDPVGEFGYRVRLPAAQAHTEPVECLRDFIAHRERQIRRTEQDLDGMRKGLAWAREMLRLEGGDES